MPAAASSSARARPARANPAPGIAAGRCAAGTRSSRTASAAPRRRRCVDISRLPCPDTTTIASVGTDHRVGTLAGTRPEHPRCRAAHRPIHEEARPTAVRDEHRRQPRTDAHRTTPGASGERRGRRDRADDDQLRCDEHLRWTFLDDQAWRTASTSMINWTRSPTITPPPSSGTLKLIPKSPRLISPRAEIPTACRPTGPTRCR